MSEDVIVFSLEKNEIVFFNITKSTWETVQRKFAAGLWDLPFELKWLAAQKLTTLLARTSLSDATYESLHRFPFFPTKWCVVYSRTATAMVKRALKVKKISREDLWLCTCLWQLCTFRSRCIQHNTSNTKSPNFTFIRKTNSIGFDVGLYLGCT